MLNYFFMISALLALSCAWANPPPCHEKGCPNVTMFLGPKWGSKVIYPNYPKFRGPSEQEPSSVNITLSDSDDQVELFADAVENDRRVPVPNRRPVPDDDSFTLDFPKDDFDPQALTPSRTANDILFEIPRLPFIFDLGLLNFTGQNLTGDGLKEKLSQQSAESLLHVRRLYLNNNKISYLPVLTFPVELEYALAVLRLDNNPLYYLSSYTRFELSRLGNLKILNLANTGLYYLDSLYLPSLEVLDLSNNRLSSVPLAFEKMTSLRHLDLSGNRISSLYGLSLVSLSQLEFLSLAGNGMIYLWHDFQFLYNLQELHLNDNMLEHAFRVYAPSDTDLYLSGNPWKCDCSLLNLVLDSTSRIVDKDNMTCLDGDPRHPTPRPVTSLTRSNMKSACERSTWETVSEGWSTASTWVLQHSPSVSTICDFLGCVLFSILIVLALRTVRQRVTPLQLPYTILDNKQAA
ncbi:uncharacterized protein LOC124357872 [Homalodisca vitripennis]|uniref:uncharacterized protein LOC124357872 n=1 Tax=Homalodisca vitripennis TaxID=197043 RepID=UPI001EEC5C49|nr:uncharacterized protein LOC124357872 [Homalodisca vitripennis]